MEGKKMLPNMPGVQLRSVLLDKPPLLGSFNFLVLHSVLYEVT